jgi:pimeloyl-ACP methyl ester carboxylesterase
MRSHLFLSAFLLGTSLAFADGPQDNNPDNVRAVPPPGIRITEEARADLTRQVDDLGREIEDLRQSLAKKPALLELLPDVQIYYNAVDYALRYDEFYSPGEVAVALKLLKQGRDRAASLRKGQSPWNTATGLVVRGYRSKIDGSVQPYGLVVPASYKAGSVHHRLDVWFHGRGEKLSELNFIEGRSKDPGQFTSAHAFVLHPYGRYCNANHFAGEIDTFEAIEHARKHYPIDTHRISVRGFSMGGAACWNFAVHYPGLWAAAAPGAGFSKTPEFLRVFQKETIKPNAWEKKLLHWYDCTDWAGNLFNVPTIAYSGELDSQKQAADIMGEAMRKEGLHLAHIIGPKTGHSYHREAKAEINRRVDSIVAKGRDPLPKRIRFTTYTLRYNAIRWVTIDELHEHWEQARMEVEIRGGRFLKGKDLKLPNGLSQDNVAVKTRNVSAFTLAIPSGYCPFENQARPITVEIDGQEIAAGPVLSDRSWTSRFRLVDGNWKLVDKADDGKLRKRHGLQGPIDDAFMSTFVMVKPTGTPINEKVGKWIASEMDHAQVHWRKQFRGELKPIDDTHVDDELLAGANLILWGDPHSNKVLAKIAARLPISWDEKAGILVGKQSFDTGHHVPVLIYPNPLNPRKYVVLNSGFSFREYDYLNNARQIPRLPDWAILDINQPRTSQRPAGIAAAGFFGERWELAEVQKDMR